jgi:cytochrome c oxidase assembly protein subunit 15
MSQKNERQVAWWLLTGAGMIMVQVLLGGITRLTGSGLSITEWKPILGTIPPLNESQWQAAFEQYKQIGQYKHLNFDFSLSDFKFIYFWEWFHRVWARLIALVFLIPFTWFMVKKKFSREMVYPMIILFLLGAMQGAIGWIMVKSGLNETNLYVSHIRLAIHFVAALGLLVYTLWFAFKLLVPVHDWVYRPGFKKLTIGISGLLILQLIYGAFMAGLKAGPFVPTWPLMNGNLIPPGMGSDKGFPALVHNPVAVQFIHRLLAYILFIGILIWFRQARAADGPALFRKTRSYPFILTIFQVGLGILTVLYSPDNNKLIWLGTFHQFTAMLLLVSLTWMVYLLNRHARARLA